MQHSAESLLALLTARGHEQYTGEPVTHLQHALQTAGNALASGAPDALVVAALFHDIGHLVHGRTGTPSVEGVDDHHEKIGAVVLRHAFGEQVAGPVRLHVLAKRCLCRSEAYLKGLTEDSIRSLRLQGGVMSDSEAVAYSRIPYSGEALLLRQWDDMGKRPSETVDPDDASAAFERARRYVATMREPARS